jgi:membrane fusion protein, copper/silver efflux system
MNNKLISMIGIMVLTLGILVIGCNNTSQKGETTPQEQTSETVYTCPMHPEVEQKGPGSCPECGMDLVPKDATGHQDDGHMHE